MDNLESTPDRSGGIMPRHRTEIDPAKEYSAAELKRLRRNESKRQWYARLSAENKQALKQSMREYSRQRHRMPDQNNLTLDQGPGVNQVCCASTRAETPHEELSLNARELSLPAPSNLSASQGPQESQVDSRSMGTETSRGESSHHGPGENQVCSASIRAKTFREELSFNAQELGLPTQGNLLAAQGSQENQLYSASRGIETSRGECSPAELNRLKRNEDNRRWYARLSADRKEALKQRMREYSRQRCRRPQMDNQPNTHVPEQHDHVEYHAMESPIEQAMPNREQHVSPQEHSLLEDTNLTTSSQEPLERQAHSATRVTGDSHGEVVMPTSQALHWQQLIERMHTCKAQFVALTWNRQCHRCHAKLLTSEQPNFCCNNGRRMLPSLPAIPSMLARIYYEPGVSKASRRLNRLFCFTALCVEGEFVRLQAPSSVAIMGRTYHQIFPTSKPDQPLHWYLHDENERLPVAERQRLSIPWVIHIGSILQTINPYCRLIKRVRDMQTDTAVLNLNGSIATGEVAAIVHANNTVTVNPRSAVFWLHKEERPIYISILDSQYEPLQYPLLFPHGTLGWHPRNDHRLSQIDWYRCRLLCEDRYLLLGRLTCEYIVDMYSRVEEEKLCYIATNGYNNRAPDLNDDDFANDEEARRTEVRLPSSFLGSRAWCSVQVADALALARAKGRPTLFITMTTNPDWPEIQSALQPGQTPAEVPTIVVRSFHARLRQLKKLLHTYFGPLLYIIHVVEFQKRGLPHAHLILKTVHDIPLEMIDSIISAEIPTDENLAQLVRKYMIHHHSTRCLTNGVCCWKYPRPITQSTHIDSRGYVQYRRRTAEDTNVVSYSPFLLKQLDCHINVDIAATVHIFMYLYAYIYKGTDRVQYHIQQGCEMQQQTSHEQVSTLQTPSTNANQQADIQDDQRQRSQTHTSEIRDYIKGRYISATEGAWRMFRFHISEKDPGVKSLPLHFQERQRSSLRRPNTASELDRYFLRPSVPEFDNVTYIEYYEGYTFLPMNRFTGAANGHLEIAQSLLPRFVVRKRTRRDAVCRIQIVMPQDGEIFYLRQLLLHTSPRTWLDLKNHNGQQYDTYQEVVAAIGLLQNTTEHITTMHEAVSSFQTPMQLRFLFSLLILDGAPALEMWQMFHMQLILDFYDSSQGNLTFASQQALLAIENVLTQHGTTVTNFGLPRITINSQLVLQELLKFPDFQTYATEARKMHDSMNIDQAQIYDHIQMCIQQTTIPKPIFIDGKAGAGKTFLLNAVCLSIRGEQGIVLPCATTALAALLYPGGRTSHSLFQIPVTDNNVGIQSMINPTSDRANLIKEAKIIIWDEFPMANKAVIESVNLLLQSICNNEHPFGGKCFVAAGDFRQIAPIVEGAGRQATLDASIKSSHLWHTFDVHHLHQEVRNASDPELAQLVSSIGESWQSDTVTFSLFQTTMDINYSRDFLFPMEILANPWLCEKRAFLSPLNMHVDDFNKSILDRLPGVGKQYFSCDYITENDVVLHDSALAENDFLHSYDHPTLPKHILHLKKGAICQVMRLLDKDKGLVKNARVVIHDLHEKYVTVRLLGVNSASPQYIHPISRVDFFHKPQNTPFTIHRRQLPLRLAYSTTFHSCLGLTLDKIVLDLRTNVFAHGQLYTALTRIRRREDALILHNTPSSIVTTRNVVFKELLEEH